MLAALDQIKRHLATDQVSSINESLDLLYADAQQAKNAIRISIRSAIENLHLREQLLLQHVDQASECIAHVVQTDLGKVAEVRGKLKACVELSKLSPVEDFHLYARECFQESQQLPRQEKPYEQGALTFVEDEGQLSKSIQHFGRIINKTSHCYTDGSERSWEFAGSDVISYTSESFETHKRSESPCHGVCTGTAFEIEDIDRHFGLTNEKPFLTLSQFCKANEVCRNMKDCLFDEPCYKLTSEDTMESNIYVAKILEDMSHFEASQKSNPENEEEQSDFQRTVTLLNERFQQIVESGPCDEMQSKRCDYSVKSTPRSVEALACETENVINGSAAEKTREPESSITASVSALSSKINAIIGSDFADNEDSFATIDLSEEMKKLSVNLQPNTKKSSNSASFLDFQSKKNSSTTEIEKQDSEKWQEDDFAFLNNITGSTTLEELNSTILGIIDS